MERIEKVLKKINKDIDDEDVQRYRECFNSKLDTYLAQANDSYLNAQACFGSELENLDSKTIEEVIGTMADCLDTMEQSQKSIDYINQIRQYVFEDIKTKKQIGFKSK